MTHHWHSWILLVSGLSLPSMALADGGVPTLKWNGDVRLRHEFISQPNPNSPTTAALNLQQSAFSQQRIQLRVGASSAVTPTSDVEFRLASGTGRTSVNQTLGASADNFSNYSITLDRAYFNYHGVEGLNVLGGRVKNTFYVAGGSDLVWDTDLNFDGLSTTYALPGAISPFITGAFYWADKTPAAALQAAQATPNQSDNKLLALQAGVKGKMETQNWAVGASFYDFTHMVGRTVIGSALYPSSGNSSTGAGGTGGYATDFRLLDFGGEFGTQFAELPVIVMFDYVTNTAALTEKSGFLAGFKVGKTKKAGDWAMGYDYRQLKKDAAVGAFADGDTLDGAGTNGHSHRVKVAYQANDALTTGVNLYFGQKGIAEGETSIERSKAQIDFMFAF